MSDIINFADWQTLQTLIQQGNATVSGMTVSEAQAFLGANANSGLYTYQAVSAVGANNVINFPNAVTAAEASAEYIASGGATSVAGAATASTGSAEAVANLSVIEGGSAGTSGVAGLLAMPLPTAAAAIAPLAGAFIGYGLYELNPDLWEKISRALLPFCYEDSELLPVMVDGNGNTYYSEEAINAVKALLSNMGEGDSATSDLNIPYDKPIPFSNDGFLKDFGGSVSHYYPGETVAIVYRSGPPGYINCVLASKEQKPRYDKSYTYNNKTVYYREEIQLDRCTILSPKTLTPNSYYMEKPDLIAWTIIYGDITSSEGVHKWKGNPYPDDATPIKVLTGYDENGKPIFIPYYPVTTPIGDPGVSTNPAVNPDPAVNPNPAPAIEPFISPVPNPNNYPESVPVSEPAPLPNPVPLPQPVPSPEINPSVDPGKLPSNPEFPKNPIDDGDSGSPVIPVIPTLPSSATGLLHVYNPTQSQIDAFGSWLWTTFSGDLIDTLSKIFNDPMDAVIGLHELYATPSTQGNATIRAGFLDSEVSSKLVGNRYTSINCGSVVVEEYYQNYLDYSPYTQVYIYLPFIGIVPVSADDIIGNAVNITYNVDSYTGCCIAVVTVAKQGYSSTVYQFEGNCAVEIPITSGYQSSLMAGLIGVAGTAISGSPSVGLTASHVGRAGLGKNTVSHSGSFGSSYGAMGCKIPYIIVRRPVQKKITDYSRGYGYPAHKMVYVGNCNGYLRAKEVIVTSTTATNLEKEMIVSALKSGVYVK